MGVVATAGMVLVVYANFQVRVTAAETARTFPGDDLIPSPAAAVNHAITIHCAPRDVWPWLVQMGSSRAGWYAYDFIDNGGRKSAERILPEYQQIGTGSLFPALPGVKQSFLVVRCEVEKNLVLSVRTPGGGYQTTWAFVLEEPQPGETRLIVRGRVAHGYGPYGLPEWAALLLGRPAHFIMERKQLLSIKDRAERQVNVVLPQRSSSRVSTIADRSQKIR